MPRMNLFPKTISVKIEHDGDDSYLQATKDEEGFGSPHAEPAQPVRVGIYRLDHIREVTMQVTSKPLNKPKK